MPIQILKGDCREVLRTLPDESVHCVVTSPPYWGLRDYGVAGQIGLEASLDDWLEQMVLLMDECRRVLRDDGTAWINIGDGYCAAPNSGHGWESSGLTKPNGRERKIQIAQKAAMSGHRDFGDLKSKDMIGAPWRLAFALRAAGWWLRQDIIWHKPNAMPESIGDRCTKAHEYLFLLSKSARYYFDADAIAEPSSPNTRSRIKMPDGWDTGAGGHGNFHRGGREKGATRDKVPGVTPKSAPEDSNIRAKGSFHASTTAILESRNKRSVWTVATKPFKESHFATFPPDLIEPCILAGCPAGGTVLDPFGGAGTTGLVADRLGRNAILIELNPEYAAMAERRIKHDAGMFADVTG